MSRLSKPSQTPPASVPHPERRIEVERREVPVPVRVPVRCRKCLACPLLPVGGVHGRRRRSPRRAADSSPLTRLTVTQRVTARRIGPGMGAELHCST